MPGPPPPRQRPKYYDLNLLHLPMPGLVSILHRITGVVMFLFMIPAVLFVLQCTLGSEAGFNSHSDSIPAVNLMMPLES